MGLRQRKKKVTACWNRGRRRDFQEAAAVGFGGRDPQDSGFGLYKACLVVASLKDLGTFMHFFSIFKKFLSCHWTCLFKRNIILTHEEVWMCCITEVCLLIIYSLSFWKTGKVKDTLHRGDTNKDLT